MSNIKGLELEIVAADINVICGKSGTGKSSVAEFLSEKLDNVDYVSQSTIRGNVRSSVSSYLDFNEILLSCYANHFSFVNEFFCASAGKAGGCKACDGTGVLRQIRDFSVSVEVVCNACNGKLFSPNVGDYKINELSIADLYDIPLEKILIDCQGLPDKFVKNLEILCSLRLGHLSLNRKTSTLSGGELRRLKLLKYLSKRRTGKILIIDEPGAGLDDVTCNALMEYLNNFSENYASIIIIDHKPSIFLNADHVIEIGRDNGFSCSKVTYRGTPMNYYKDKYIPYITR